MKIINKKSKIFCLILLIIIIFIIWSLIFINKKIEKDYNSKILKLENLNYNKVWLVLWAWAKNWILSELYKDRLKTAYFAYKNKKISKILISWDNSTKFYDELTPAWIYLYDLWVDEKDIFLDYAWFDTYDSIYRAKEIFWNNSLTIFTQEFHLKRALYICQWLKLQCIWTKTDLRKYLYINSYNTREIFARYKAFLNIIFKSKPHFLWEKIDMNNQNNFKMYR